MRVGEVRLIYLGHRIGDGRMAVPGDRASAVGNFIRPTTKKGVRVFLGTCGYYRNFVQNFGKVAEPLTRMTRKLKPERVQWTPRGSKPLWRCVSPYVMHVC